MFWLDKIGYVKEVLAQQTGLGPADQKLCFRGRERDDDEILQAVGVKDLAKLLVLEQPASQELFKVLSFLVLLSIV